MTSTISYIMYAIDPDGEFHTGRFREYKALLAIRELHRTPNRPYNQYRKELGLNPESVDNLVFYISPRTHDGGFIVQMWIPSEERDKYIGLGCPIPNKYDSGNVGDLASYLQEKILWGQEKGYNGMPLLILPEQIEIWLRQMSDQNSWEITKYENI